MTLISEMSVSQVANEWLKYVLPQDRREVEDIAMIDVMFLA